MKLLVFLSLVLFSPGVALPGPVSAATISPVKATYQALPNPGKKVPLGAEHYFTFGFEKQPKLGSAIMKVEIFTLEGQREKNFIVKGDLDMPSMRGAHGTGDRKFALSAKGVYLLPVQLPMPGDWEFRFTFESKGKTVFRGAYLFDL